ncbi:MAG: acyl carrier protein [Spirochaetales bacterium]|nr:acyl carrier protein [Spirochaetales bacterium]
MDRKQIFDKLKEILSFSFSDSSEILDKCSESSNLVTDLGLNSVGMLFMVISIEEAFSVSFENVNFSSFVTVKDVIDYIEEKRRDL